MAAELPAGATATNPTAEVAGISTAEHARRARLPVGSPEWSVYRLEAELRRRRPLTDLYEDYYEGRHRLNFATSKFREVFGQMLSAVSDNWMPLTIRSSVERLKVTGFRLGEVAEGQRQTDPEAWRLWQENSLDADAPLLLTEAAKHGEGYLLVWPEGVVSPGVFGRFLRRRTEVRPRITVEHPSEMIVARHPGDRRRRASALKMWQEDDGTWMATLYLPEGLFRFQRKDQPGAAWKARAGVEYMDQNPLGVVPVVPVVNDPHMLPCLPPQALLAKPHSVPKVAIGLGRSDLADGISTQDQINKLLCDMLVASEVGAFRQRWATGLEVPIDETTGKAKEPFEHAINRLWATPGKDVEFGEFSATDLKNFIAAIEQRVVSLAARTRTPPHYLLGQIVNASGDALKAAETSLVAKVDDKKISAGEGLEEAMRLAFAFMGDKERAQISDGETVWAHSESRSESEFVDSLVKKMALGIPKEQLWEDAGYSPQQIRNFKGMLRDAAAEMALFDPADPESQGLPPEPNAGA